MSTATIRKASINELEPLAVLFDTYRQFYEQAPDIALAKAFIAARLNNKDSVIFVAENSEGKLIGFSQVYLVFARSSLQKLAYFMIYMWILAYVKQALGAH